MDKAQNLDLKIKREKQARNAKDVLRSRKKETRKMHRQDPMKMTRTGLLTVFHS